MFVLCCFVLLYCSFVLRVLYVLLYGLLFDLCRVLVLFLLFVYIVFCFRCLFMYVCFACCFLCLMCFLVCLCCRLSSFCCVFLFDFLLFSFFLC